MDVKSIVCTQCGSSDIDLIAEDYGICRMCGTKVLFKQEKPSTVISQEVHVHGQAGADYVKTTAGVIKAEYTTEEFMREVLLSLAEDVRTPVDIFDAEFMPVRKEYRQLLGVKAKVDLSYSATIGFDRKEEYWDKEKDYDSASKQYVYRDVKKTRTVTDWNPTSGNYSCECYEFADNSDNDELSYSSCETFKKQLLSLSDASGVVYETNEVDFETEFPREPSAKGKEKAKKACEIDAKSRCRSSLSGDHVKDFTASAQEPTVRRLDTFCSPEYKVEYDYDGDKCENCAFPFGSMIVRGDIISDAKDVQGKIDKKSLSFVIAATVALLLSIAMSIVLRNPVLVAVFFAIGVVLFVLSIIIPRKISKKVKTDKQKAKEAELGKYLEAHGFKALDASDSARIIKGAEQ